MKLYHYSTEKQDILIPPMIDYSVGRLAAQKMMGEARFPPTRGKGPWGTGLLCFHDRVSLPAVREVFGNTNPYWPEGIILHEHVIDIDTLTTFFYLVMDPPELVGYEPGAPGTGQSYPEKWGALMKEHHYLGTSTEHLNAATLRLMKQGSMGFQIRQLKDRADFDTLAGRESMGLPMVVLYRQGGPITTFEHIER